VRKISRWIDLKFRSEIICVNRAIIRSVIKKKNTFILVKNWREKKIKVIVNMVEE
jgi:hypothetical protein